MIKRFVLLFSLILMTGKSFSGVIIGGTRVIFDSTKKEVNLNIENPDKEPFLIQSWIDSNGMNDNLKNMPKAPFIVTPPLFRLEGRSQNLLRIIAKKNVFPNEK
ncbi:fimbria/pilus periplasmic chaperone, partial [Enterobacter cloacae complex sp. P4RS]|uniref:fimbrial biogenesis chaperone n=1 Tax=Enterobacter cloacae complex sp. P4RS TaxID=2779590 RepID=UPI001876337F